MECPLSMPVRRFSGFRRHCSRARPPAQVKTDVLPHAIAADLREKLRTFRPHVIHFIGHGGFQDDQGMLVMEDDERKTRLVSDKQFREFFLGADDAKLVILNACQGATQSSARALSGLAPQIVRRGLGAVVAMQYPIPDKVALSFAREFYRALAAVLPGGRCCDRRPPRRVSRFWLRPARLGHARHLYALAGWRVVRPARCTVAAGDANRRRHHHRRNGRESPGRVHQHQSMLT